VDVGEKRRYKPPPRVTFHVTERHLIPDSIMMRIKHVETPDPAGGFSGFSYEFIGFSRP